MKWRCTSSMLTYPAGILPCALKTHPMEPKMPSLSSHRFCPSCKQPGCKAIYALPYRVLFGDGSSVFLLSPAALSLRGCQSSVRVSSETCAITGRLAVLGCSPGQLPSPVCRSQPCKRMLMLRLRAYVTALPPLEFPVSPWD